MTSSESIRNLILKLLGGTLTLLFFITFSLQHFCILLSIPVCSSVSPQPRTIFEWISPIFTAVLLLFTQWAWRKKIGRWLGWKIPDIQGTWRGELEILHHVSGINRPLNPIPIILVIRQSALGIKISLHTSESSSNSIAAEFIKIDSENELIYSYRNEPDPRQRARSSIHIGTTILKMSSLKPSVLSGEYYTERLTNGRLSLTHYTPILAVSFNDALSLNFEARPIIR